MLLKAVPPLKTSSLSWLPLLLLLCLIAHCAKCATCNGSPTCQALPQRFLVIERAPGVGYNQEDPASINASTLTAIVDSLQPPSNASIRFGVAFLFSLLDDATNGSAVERSIANLLAASQATGIAVFIGLDCENWWQASNLWNWFDASQPGYDPQLKANVESTGWPGDPAAQALKIAWRNWGSQIRITPAPNLFSPSIMALCQDRLARASAIIGRWVASSPDNLNLLAGVKIGWEAGIGYNQYYYPDGNQYWEKYPHDPSHDPTYGLNESAGIAAGLVQQGYAASASSGWRSQGPPLDRWDIGNLTQMYLANLTRTAFASGLPSSRLYTHSGGTASDGKSENIPYDAAYVDHAMPGWSVYGVPPSENPQLMAALARRQNYTFGAVEWGLADFWQPPGPPLPTRQLWQLALNMTFSTGDCRVVSIYNWDRDIDRRPDVQAGIRDFLVQFQ